MNKCMRIKLTLPTEPCTARDIDIAGAAPRASRGRPQAVRSGEALLNVPQLYLNAILLKRHHVAGQQHCSCVLVIQVVHVFQLDDFADTVACL